MNAITGTTAVPEDIMKRRARNMGKLRQIINAIRVNNRKPSEEGYKKAMKLLNEYSDMKQFKRSLAYRMRRIMRKENDFILGMAELISNNFDYIFRYLYAAAFILLIAG